ncbi:TIGR02300 family protein [Enterovirga sp. CN4-39]|uniref:TIGR02300 family protein n=1 Tax=Enterovirga sp. CN4-39 TaxID=3400910 RepID=UPI003C0B2755
MARPELGTKRVCPTTGRKFYDLNRDPIVSPYTGEVVPRSAFELATKPAAGTRARPDEDEDETEAAAGGAEIISLEDVAEGEDAAATAEDDVTLEDEGGSDDAFLEEEEEGGDDVTDLIDGDIEEEEES